MIPEWLSFWNEFIPSPYVSLYLFILFFFFTCFRSRESHSGFHSEWNSRFATKFHSGICKLKTIFVLVSQRHGHPRVLGVPIPQTLVIWTSLVTLTHITKVISEGNIHISKRFGNGDTQSVGMPVSLYHRIENRKSWGSGAWISDLALKPRER